MSACSMSRCTNTSYLATWYLNEGFNQPAPAALGPSVIDAVPALQNGGRLDIPDVQQGEVWPTLCGAVGRPEWAEDPRFLRFKNRLENRALITEILDEALQARTTADWLARFAGIVPAAPVNDIAGALDNPFVVENAGSRPSPTRPTAPTGWSRRRSARPSRRPPARRRTWARIRRACWAGSATTPRKSPPCAPMA